MYGLLELAKRNGIENVYVHAFLDGRDTAPTSGLGFVKELEDKMNEIGVGKVASVIGRYYVMDRDNRWERVELAYDALVNGKGVEAESATKAIEASYAEEVTDEFVKPTVIMEDGKPVATIKENDSVIFFNFRPDRAREITRSLCDEEFKGFERKKGFMKLCYVCFTEYDVTIPNKLVAFHKVEIKNTFGEFLAANGLKQLRTAETEKYAHVTFFFNGGVEEPNEGEERKLVNSPKVATYDLQPEMSAYEVCDNVLSAIDDSKYGFILVNFANPDMVAHTGVIEAAEKACHVVDECVGKIADACKANGITMILTADHGNAEVMVDESTGKPQTAHTTNEVPFVIINGPKGISLKNDGALCNVAPTVLELMGIKKPAEMDCDSLIKEPVKV